eukprot:13727529-Alexandrium_andersonii.AAC.1
MAAQRPRRRMPSRSRRLRLRSSLGPECRTECSGGKGSHPCAAAVFCQSLLREAGVQAKTGASASRSFTKATKRSAIQPRASTMP